MIGMMAMASIFVIAKDKTVKTIIRSWQLPLSFGVADTACVDTAFQDFPMRDMLNDYSISNVWNGNIVSPVQSRIYFARTNHIDDIFADNYQPYILTPQTIQFYNTTVPYSRIAYKKGFVSYHEENDLSFMFTGNINSRFNLGLQLNYLNSPGHYSTQEGKLFNGALFGSYNGTHYNLHASVAYNNLSNFENGGIRDVNDLGGPLRSEDLPVNMAGMSGYRFIEGYLNHYYSFCTEHERKEKVEFVNNFGEKDTKDTVIVDYVPFLSIGHTFETTNSVRRYIEQNANQGYYTDTFRNPLATNDTSNVLTINNTLYVTFEEAFNRKLMFGATVYARNECQRHLNVIGAEIDSTRENHWTNNTFLGAAIHKNSGKWIRYGVDGDVCLVGYKQWEFHVNGHIDANFKAGKDTMYISASTYVKNVTPQWYLNHYNSNHFRWENDFKKTYRFFVGGKIAYPTQWVKPAVKIGFENITQYIYFDQTGLPTQMDGNLQVLSADVTCNITTPWINLDNNVVYQLSSSAAMPLPSFTLYHNLYYHGTWFKALDAQIGVDLRYFTRYYAPLLNPATGQFCVQDKVEIGNYPVMNVYASFNVRSIHLKFFAHYTHFNNLFMRKDKNFLIMPSYPYNPDIFRAGIAWQFYR